MVNFFQGKWGEHQEKQQKVEKRKLNKTSAHSLQEPILI